MTANDDHSKDSENVIPVTGFLYKKLDKLVNTPAVAALKKLYPEHSWERLTVVELLEDPEFAVVGLGHESISYVDPVKLISLMAHKLAAAQMGMDGFSLYGEDGEVRSDHWTAFAPKQPFDGSEETNDEGEPLLEPEDLTNPEEKKCAEYTYAFESAVNEILLELLATYDDDIFNPVLLEPSGQ